MEQTTPLPNPATPPQMPINPLVKSSSTNKPVLLVLLVILLVILSSLGTYFIVKSQAPSQTPVNSLAPTPSTFPTPSTPDETTNWKTYKNSKLEFTFKYPNNWDPTIEESVSSKEKEIAFLPYMNISINFIGGWMGKNVKEEKINIDGVEGIISLWLNCSSNDAQEWEKCNSQLNLDKYDTAILRTQFNKGQDKWLVTSQYWKKGEKNEDTELDNFKQILSTFKFD